MTFKIIGGPPAETPYAYLAVKPKPLTLTADEAVMRMPSPDSTATKHQTTYNTTSAYTENRNDAGGYLSSFPSPSPRAGPKTHAQASVEKIAQFQSQQQGPPLWSPRNPLFHTNNVNNNDTNNNSNKNVAATSSDVPNNNYVNQEHHNGTALSERVEDPIHQEGNYAKRLFEEILEARTRRLQEYDDYYNNTRQGQSKKNQQQKANTNSTMSVDTEEEENGNDTPAVERKLLFDRAQQIIAALEKEDDYDSEDDSQTQQNIGDRTDEEEIALLKARRIRKQKRLQSEAYARDRDADMQPWCNQLLWQSIWAEIDYRTSCSEREADLVLLQINEEEGLRREAARMAEAFVHSAIVAERERRYFDTVDPVMSKLRREAEARRLAAAQREAALEEEELAALERKLELMSSSSTTTTTSTGVGRKQQQSSAALSKASSSSNVNEALRARQQQLAQQRQDAARYEQQQQQSSHNAGTEEVIDSKKEEVLPPAAAPDAHKFVFTKELDKNKKSNLIAPNDVASLLNVIELAADSDNLGRGLSLLLQGMDL